MEPWAAQSSCYVSVGNVFRIAKTMDWLVILVKKIRVLFIIIKFVKNGIESTAFFDATHSAIWLKIEESEYEGGPLSI
jgi:hypothetical protein